MNEQLVEKLLAQMTQLNENIVKLLAFIPGEHDKLPSLKLAEDLTKLIPDDLKQELQVVGFEFDGSKPWFKMIQMSGSTISVKRNEFDFRIRARDANGELVKEITPSHNGLVAALKSLV